MRKQILTALAGMFLLAALVVAQDTQIQSFTVPLSDPGSPAVVKASVIHGTIVAEAYDGAEVLVEVEMGPGDDEEVREVGGMKRIPSYSAGVTIEERGNVVHVETDWSDEHVVIKLQVPVQTALHLDVVNGDDIVIMGVQGDHELSNVNAGIKAIDIRGSVIADTTNGDVTINFLEIVPDKPMSFTSFNGDVDVTFPTGLQADLYMQSGQGDVYTDFDVQIRPTSPRVTREDGRKGYRVRMEQAVEGSVGGGGPEMRFKTYNGDIYLRRQQ